MSKDERILKKVGKLLTLYGVNDDEKAKFIADLQDKKYDDQDELEETETEEVETEEVEEELPAEEVGDEEVSEEVSEVAEEPGEPEPAEPVEEPTEEPAEEQPAEVPEQVEQPMEEVPAEQPVEEPQPQEPANDPRFEELGNTIQGLTDRIASLEDIVKKLGAPVEESVGVEPHNPSGESLKESEMDRINRLRMGR